MGTKAPFRRDSGTRYGGDLKRPGATMRRRNVVKAIATSAAAWPFIARAQPNKVRRVGVLLGLSENDPKGNARVKAFRLSMRDLEWIEGATSRLITGSPGAIWI